MQKRGENRKSGARAIPFIIFFLAASLLLSSSPCQADGTTIYVDSTNTSSPWDGTAQNPYQHISDAVTAATTGDTISIASGTYGENIVITKTLTINGENKETTIIDGGRNGHTVYAYGSAGNEIHVSLSNLTIRNAGGVGYDCIAYSYVTSSTLSRNNILSSEQSDGVQLAFCSQILLANNNIANNLGGAGITMYMSENNGIDHNTISQNQKGIYFYYSNGNDVHDNSITGNSQFGVHIVVPSSGNIFFANNFMDNDGVNAQDPSTNSWINLGQGNYWDDYNNYDSDENGIGDVPYSITGGSNTDAYPLGYFLDEQPPGGGSNKVPEAHNPFITPNPAMYAESVYFSSDGSDTDGYITAYQWRSSRDGVLSDQKSFSTSSLTIGSHVISFKVKDNDGDWSDEKTVTLTVTQSQNKIPTAYIDTISPNPAEQRKMIHFVGYGIDSDGSIIGWKWTSSLDGDIGSQPSFYSKTLSAGTHIISFQVKDNDNIWSNATSKAVVVTPSSSTDPSSNDLPVADAGGPYTALVNIEITFNGTACYDNDGTIIMYVWSDGQGFSGNGVSPKHTFTAPGTYTLTLEVTDDNGDTSTDTTTITINDVGQPTSGSGDFLSQINIPFPILLILCGVGIAIVAILGFLSKLKKMR